MTDYVPETKIPEITKCRFRTPLEGQEVECVLRGPHEYHKYIAPKSGKIHRFEIVNLDGVPL